MELNSRRKSHQKKTTLMTEGGIEKLIGRAENVVVNIESGDVG
jgi:hypothetical protein